MLLLLGIQSCPTPCFLLLLFMALSAHGAFDAASYPNSTQLNSDYKVFWKVDFAAKKIQLALQVNTLGWIGFGLGEPTSGSMPGADVAVVSFETGSGTIGDYYTVDYITPSKDSCQDWTLISSQLIGGVRTVEISRALDTGDSQDRAIVAGMTRIIFAYGSSSATTLQYHGTSNRKMATITFWPTGVSENVIAETNLGNVTYTLNNFPVPTQTTTYACIAFGIPKNTPDQHVVRIDPIVGSSYAHHLLVHICANTTGGYVEKYYQNPGSCNSPVGNPQSGCYGLLYAWALGIDSLILPPEAGYRAGFSSSAFSFVVVEVHLNNPSLTAGQFDSTGVRIHYTDQLRKYDAATMTLGDPAVYLPSIPPGVKQNLYEMECPSACTSKFTQPITVFASFQHMHSIGKQMWTTQYRNGAFVRTTNRVEFFDYGAQQQTRLNFTIQPGDNLLTHCVFDSTTRSSATPFGVNSIDEMCMDFISYYPALKIGNSAFSYCGFVRNAQTNINYTLCGSVSGLRDFSSILAGPNPKNSDLFQTVAKTFSSPGTCGSSTQAPTETPTKSSSDASALKISLFAMLALLMHFLAL